MISSLPNKTTDNKAIFVFQFITPFGEYWISDTEIPLVSTVDYQTLQFGGQSPLQTKVPSVMNGGTIEYSANFELTIIDSPDSTFADSFYNSFYPNTPNVLLHSKVAVYITWEGVTSSNDFVRLFSGKIVEYSYSDSIYLTIERTVEFINSKLPLYKTQKKIDNGISYTDVVDEDKLDITIPIVYGDYRHSLAVEDPQISGSAFDLKPATAGSIPLHAAIPIVTLSNDFSKVIVASHSTHVDSTSTKLLHWDDYISHYFDVYVMNPYTGAKNTSSVHTISGTMFNSVKTRDQLLFVGDIKYIPLHTGVDGDPHGTVGYTGGNKYSGFNNAALITARGTEVDNFKLHFESASNAPSYNLFSNTTDSLYSGWVVHIYGYPSAPSAGDVANLTFRTRDGRYTTGAYPILGDTIPFEALGTVPGTVYMLLESTDLIPLARTAGYNVSNIAYTNPKEKSSTPNNEANISISNTEYVFYNTIDFNLNIHNVIIELQRVILGGNFAKRTKIIKGLGAPDYNISIYYEYGDLKEDNYKEVVSLNAYICGRIAQYVNSTSTYEHWIKDYGNRVNGYTSNSVLNNPAYIIESIIRDEAQKLYDLQIHSYYQSGSSFFMYIQNLPFKNRTDFYDKATLGIPEIDKEFLILSFTSHVSIGEGENVIEIYDGTGSLSSSWANTKSVYISNINPHIDTTSFDEIGNTTNGSLKNWKLRRSIDTEEATNSILNTLAFETFTLLTDTNQGLTLIDIFDTTVRGTLTTPLVVNGSPQISFALDTLQNIYTDITINYDYDFGSGNYLKTRYYGAENSYCKDAYETYGVKNSYTYNSKWHYDETTVSLFANRLLKWLTFNHAIVTYVGDVEDHIQYEIGDTVLIAHDKIPRIMKNTTPFLIIGREIVQFPVPSVKFTLVSKEKPISEITWDTTNINWENDSINWENA